MSLLFLSRFAEGSCLLGRGHGTSECVECRGEPSSGADCPWRTRRLRYCSVTCSPPNSIRLAAIERDLSVLVAVSSNVAWSPIAVFLPFSGRASVLHDQH